MKLGNEVKRDTQLIIISVLVLTIVTLSVSYSAFFSVRSQSTVQQITAGTLDVIIDSTSTGINADELYPTLDSDLPSSSTSSASGTYASLNLKNNGSLDADFSVALQYDTNLPSGKTTSDLISFSYLKVGVYDTDNNVWLDFGNGAYYIDVTGLTASEAGVYPVLRSTINAGDTRQFRIYVWLDEDTPITEIDKLVYLKLSVKSTTVSENSGS